VRHATQSDQRVVNDLMMNTMHRLVILIAMLGASVGFG
jgi:hypothetical protein